MKKYFILCFTAFLFIGCGNTMRDSWNYFPKEVNLGKFSHLDFIKVKQGKTVKVDMGDDAVGGYKWVTQTNSDCSVSVSETTAEGSTAAAFEVSGSNAGTCLVEFQKFAPGETEKPFERKAIYFVVE